jgi:hypothetical protein
LPDFAHESYKVLEIGCDLTLFQRLLDLALVECLLDVENEIVL